MSRLSPGDDLEIEVTDLGPIAEAQVALRPLTVFVGPGNTGNSYFATLVYALHRHFGGRRPLGRWTMPENGNRIPISGEPSPSLISTPSQK